MVLSKMNNHEHRTKQTYESYTFQPLMGFCSYPIPEYLLKRLQRVLLAAAGFVLGRYADMLDLIKLGWMPMRERSEYQLLNTVFKALH